MAFYRAQFPWATVIPKLHVMEDHVIPWLRRFHVGAGLMGEQGAESIHARVMKLETFGVSRMIWIGSNTLWRSRHYTQPPHSPLWGHLFKRRKIEHGSSDDSSDDSSGEEGDTEETDKQ